DILPVGLPYARIISLSYIFSLICASGPFLIRADGSPMFALACIAVGSVLNIVLDAVFILIFGWGIQGAAWATLIAQAVSAAMVIRYMTRFKVLKLTREDFLPDAALYCRMAAIGAGPAFNFLTQAMVQILLNNSLKVYGAASPYGSERCLAVAGVANKVNTLAVAIVVGLTNGLQPISSYNFGRKNYRRVIQASKAVVGTVLLSGFVIFLLYRLFPVQIVSFFGEGDELYFDFAKKYFRIFYLLIALFGLQSSIAGFFSSQGKVSKSITISLVRQVIFFPLMLLILPRIFGLTGVLWSGPVSDLAMAVVAGTLFAKELRKLEALSEAQVEQE
ncbi:MAG: polysaccharide biosynthesis C-terminal domain-containing protein, partial [Mogibacterium sp.]|nr:polysaccharide biosynthesis C-terminal domain-containing protein [Mogibacterium sp.]